MSDGFKILWAQTKANWSYAVNRYPVAAGVLAGALAMGLLCLIFC